MAEIPQLRPIQPVDLPGFQYSITRPQAGRNKYQDLADALSKINPALAQFGRISAAKQQLIQQQEEEKRKAYEAQIQAGREAAYFGVDPISEGLKKVSRKAVEGGQLLDNDNAAFQIGALQAKGVTAVKGAYRDLLYSQLNTLEGDIGEFIEKSRLEFIKRPEFADPSVRSFAFDAFNKVEDEFRNDVEKIRDDARTEDFKRAWLELGRPVVDQVIKGQLDVNDPNIIGWLNHSAGVFKGSQEYAWTNLFSETLKEGLSKDPSEEGSISPQQAETFLDKLRTLDLGGGVKFADAEVGKGITEFYNYIEDRRSKWESKKSEQYNREYMVNLAQAETEILQLMGDSDTISPTDEARIKRELRDKTPLHLKTQVNKNINDLLGEIRKPSTESTQLSVANFELLIDEGDDLDKTLDSVMKAAADRAITPKERNALIQRIESSRNFTKLVYDDPVMKTLRNGYRETITGFEQFKAGKSTGIPVGFFTRLGVSTKLQVESLPGEGGIVPPEQNFGVYYQILRSLGKDAADMFVNKRYVAFERDLRQAFEGKFNELEQDEETSPQEAKAKILEQMESISEKVFKAWSEESITLAVDKYKVNPVLFNQGLEAQ
jgi:hypothetical protein